MKRKAAPPALDADVLQRQKDRIVAGSQSFDDKIKALIEAKALEAQNERVVYKIAGLPEGLGWGEIKDALKEAVKTEGKIFIVHEDGATEAFVSAFAKDSAEKFASAADAKKMIKDKEYSMTQVTDTEALKAYWVDQFTQNPPRDLDKEINKVRSAKKNASKSPGGKKRKATSGPVTVAGVEYVSKDALMAKCAEIAKKNPSEELEVLAGADKEFAAALLNFHPNADAKKKTLKDLAVGKNPEHPSTRCFFAVQEDGSKIDFSYIKCISEIPEDAPGSPSAKKAKAE